MPRQTPRYAAIKDGPVNAEEIKFRNQSYPQRLFVSRSHVYIFKSECFVIKEEIKNKHDNLNPFPEARRLQNVSGKELEM